MAKQSLPQSRPDTTSNNDFDMDLGVSTEIGTTQSTTKVGTDLGGQSVQGQQDFEDVSSIEPDQAQAATSITGGEEDMPDPVQIAKDMGMVQDDEEPPTFKDEETGVIRSPGEMTLDEIAQGVDTDIQALRDINPNIDEGQTLTEQTLVNIPTALQDDVSALTATTPTSQKTTETDTTAGETFTTDQLETGTATEDALRRAEEDVTADTTDAEAFMRSLQTAGSGPRRQGMFEEGEDFAQEPIEEGEARQRGLLGEFSRLKGEFERKPEREKELRRKFGFQDQVERLQDVRQREKQLAGQFEQLITGAEGRPVASSLITGRKQQLRAQKAAEVGALTSIREALVGNINTAKKLAEDTAAMEFEPVKKKIDAISKAIDLNKKNLNRDETQRADRLKFVLDERKRLINKKESERASVLKFAQSVANKGANVDTVQKISEADTVERAVQEAAPFLKKVKDFQRAQGVVDTLGMQDGSEGQEADTEIIDTEQGKQLVDKQTGNVLRTFGTEKEAKGAQQAKNIKNKAIDLLNDPNFEDFTGKFDRSIPFEDLLTRTTGELDAFDDKMGNLIQNETLGKLGEIAGSISEEELRLARRAASILAPDEKDKKAGRKWNTDLPAEDVKEALQDLAEIQPELEQAQQQESGDGGNPFLEDFNQEMSSSEKGLTELKQSIIQQESGGSYTAVGPTPAGMSEADKALGRYQIVPKFHFDKIGLENTPENRQKFLNSPELQDKLFSKIIDGLAQRYDNDPKKIAAAYYGGGGGASVVGTEQGDKPQFAGGQKMPSVNQYVNQVLSRTNNLA